MSAVWKIKPPSKLVLHCTKTNVNRNSFCHMFYIRCESEQASNEWKWQSLNCFELLQNLFATFLLQKLHPLALWPILGQLGISLVNHEIVTVIPEKPCHSCQAKKNWWWMGVLMKQIFAKCKIQISWAGAWSEIKYKSLCPHPSSTLLYSISLLSGMLNIDDQCRNPNMNNKDHILLTRIMNMNKKIIYIVGQLTVRIPALIHSL